MKFEIINQPDKSEKTVQVWLEIESDGLHIKTKTASGFSTSLIRLNPDGTFYRWNNLGGELPPGFQFDSGHKIAESNY